MFILHDLANYHHLVSTHQTLHHSRSLCTHTERTQVWHGAISEQNEAVGLLKFLLQKNLTATFLCTFTHLVSLFLSFLQHLHYFTVTTNMSRCKCTSTLLAIQYQYLILLLTGQSGYMQFSIYAMANCTSLQKT